MGRLRRVYIRIPPLREETSDLKIEKTDGQIQYMQNELVLFITLLRVLLLLLSLGKPATTTPTTTTTAAAATTSSSTFTTTTTT